MSPRVYCIPVGKYAAKGRPMWAQSIFQLLAAMLPSKKRYPVNREKGERIDHPPLVWRSKYALNIPGNSVENQTERELSRIPAYCAQTSRPHQEGRFVILSSVADVSWLVKHFQLIPAILQGAARRPLFLVIRSTHLHTVRPILFRNS